MNLFHILSKHTKSSFAQDSVIIFIGTMVANIGSYLYHLIVGRILGPVGYGELSSLISLLYIAGVPTNMLQTVLVKYFSICEARNADGQAKDLFIRTTKFTILLLGIVGVGVFLIAPHIAQFLQLHRWSMIVWVYGIFFVSTLSIISASVFQGYQRFIWYSIFLIVGIALKLILSIPLAYQGVEWTLIAFFISLCLTYAIILFPIRFLLKSKIERMDITKRDTIFYAIPTLLTILGFTSLYSADVVLVKHYFSADVAGVYAALSVLGKIIFYASSAVIIVMFPKISKRYEKHEQTEPLVRISFFTVTGLSLCITGIYFFFPVFVTHLLFGTAYNGLIPYIGLFGVFITFFSMGNLLAMVCLAIGKTAVWIFPMTAAAIQYFGITYMHSSLFAIVVLNIGISFLTVMSVGFYYLYSKKDYHL